MKTLLLTLAFLGALSLGAATEIWEIDNNHTSVSFDVGHLGISKVRGLMNTTSGSIRVDPKDILSAAIEVTLDVKSLNTMVPKRDAHVKSADFLDAEKFPTIQFVSTAIREDKALKKLFIDGNLTMKGKTKKVTLESSPISEEVRQEMGGKTRIIRAALASTTINRFDFGIDYGKGKPIDGGVSKDITITISAEFAKKDDVGAVQVKTSLKGK